MTAEAPRRRAVGHILLLAAGLLVLIAISAGSVHPGQQGARGRARGSCTPSRSKTRYRSSCCSCGAPKAHSAAISLTLRPDFRADFAQAICRTDAGADAVERAHQRQSGSKASSSTRSCRSPTSGSRNSHTTIELARTQRMNDAAKIVREGIGRDTMKHIEDLAVRMRAEEDRLFVERTTNADRSQTLAASITGIGSGFVDRAGRHLDLPGAALVARTRRGRRQAARQQSQPRGHDRRAHRGPARSQ